MIRRRSVLCTGLGLLVAACIPVTRPDGGIGLLSVGATAPEVMGMTRAGTLMTLSAARGRPAVLYFYPKDGTPGCTREACAFRDAFTQFESRRVTVFGVSRDSKESHRRFRADHGLPFILVADEDGAVARAYGVSSVLGMASRVTFLVGGDGKILRVWPDVDPAVNADEVLAAVDLAETRGAEIAP